MEENTATETSAPTIAPEEDLELKVAALEAEKAKVLEEKENYRLAYLKESKKHDFYDEPDEDKLRRIAREELQNSRFAELEKQKDELLAKALKENKELKLAHLNKVSTSPASLGSHSESTPVKDTMVTPEQMDYFKSRGWSDKDIERYKANLRKKI